MNAAPDNPQPTDRHPLNYARTGESITPTDPFDRQVVGLFRGFIYLMVLVPCAAAMIAVAGLMLARR